MGAISIVTAALFLIPVSVNAAKFQSLMPHGTKYEGFPTWGLECPFEDPRLVISQDELRDAAAEMYVKKDWNNWVSLYPSGAAHEAHIPLIGNDRHNAITFFVDYDPKGPTFTYRGRPSHHVLDPATGEVRANSPCEEPPAASRNNHYLASAAAQQTPMVCGIPRPGDHGFGDDDSETGLSAAEPIEWIAFSVVGPANAPIVSSLEIKYANHNILLHGTVRGRRSQMFFDLNRREHVTQVRLDCGGPADKRKIQFISIKSNLGRIKADGKSNPADSHTFDIRGKRVVSFRGYTNRYDTLQTLGIGWAREGFGKKP